MWVEYQKEYMQMYVCTMYMLVHANIRSPQWATHFSTNSKTGFK